MLPVILVFQMLSKHPELTRIRVIRFSNEDGIPIRKGFPQRNIIGPGIDPRPEGGPSSGGKALEGDGHEKRKAFYFQKVYIF